MCRWKSTQNHRYECKVDKNPDYCILHGPKEGKSVDDFRECLYRQLDQTGNSDTRNEQFNFSGYVFPERVVCRAERGEGKEIVLPVRFTARADFGEATFEKEAYFGRETVFEQEAHFEKADFKESAYFGKTTFKRGASFRAAQFQGRADFWHATFEKEADFREAAFGQSAFFGEAAFLGVTDFEFCEAREISLGEQFPKVTAVLRHGLGLRQMARGAGPSFWAFARRMYERTGERERADAAYYFERIWRQMAALLGPAPRRIGGLLGFPVDLLLRWSIAYGTSFPRTILSWLLIVLTFGVVYAAIPSVLGRHPDCIWTLSNWASAVFASGSCFAKLALGSRELIPAAGKGLLLFESVIGSVLVALTVAVITRKTMR